jgi:hypothetical protein
MIYFGPGPSLTEVAVVVIFAVVAVGFVLRGIIRSEERRIATEKFCVVLAIAAK